MREAKLSETLRHALLAALAGLPMALTTACGGAVNGPGPRGDAGETDATQSCGVAVCNVDCAFGDKTEQVCVNGVPECICVAGPTVDAGIPDVRSAEAGDPCHPTLACGGSSIPLSCFDAKLEIDGAVPTAEQCTALCGTADCMLQTSSGATVLMCYVGCLGRRPPGLCPSRAVGSFLGRYFAEAAHLEAASVDAFEVLRSELDALGAPLHLRRAATRARADEVRHARMTLRLARRFGGRTVRPGVTRPALRSLEALAMENAAEGCVRETFGALFAMHQAEAAADPRVQATMASIAPDEVRHAALGWEVAAWADAQLSPDGRERVRAARQAAIAELRSELACEIPAALRQVTGLPSQAVALRMLDSLAASLWSDSGPAALA